jgi:gluconolactonase
MFCQQTLTGIKNLLRLTMIVCLPVLLAIHCSAQKTFPVTGSIERLDNTLDAILSPTAKAEIIATGFDWSEGPLWIEPSNMLLFSDVPRNTIYKWTEEKGTEVYLTPSGYTGTAKRGGETGSNGLTLDAKGRLVLSQHGDRRIARMDAPIDQPKAKFTTLAGSYKGKKFDSPNDVVYNSKGELFFTDPPYGLEKYINDPLKELSFQGVYRVTMSGEVMLLTDTITRPNGVAFLPGEKTLLVANSDGKNPHWYAIDLADNGSVSQVRIFASVWDYDKNLKGGNDGLKVDKNGNVFATGPGGIWILNDKGKLLGRIRLQEAVSNCALSPDEKTLYITNDMQVLRVKMR